MIQLTDVTVRLGDTDVLHHLHATLPGRTVAVIGENGSGKSTLARLIGGLTRPTSGQMRILGRDPTRHARELRRRVAVVFSNPDAQIIMPTVAEDVGFSLRGTGLPAAQLRARVDDMLGRVGLLPAAHRSPYELSGGQKQLLAVAGALVRQPDLVVADEPTAYLDARNAARVAGHLLTGSHRLVLVTHDLALARRCEHAVLVEHGRIVTVGPPEQIVHRYEASLQC